MKLNELMRPWVDASLPDVEVLGLGNDSRRLNAGFVFFAYPGYQTDGRLFIKQALEAGAVFIIYDPQNWPSEIAQPTPEISVGCINLAEKLPIIASHFYQHPSQELTVIGVTGTNGKTSIAYQLAQASLILGEPAAYIGTIGQGMLPTLMPTLNTTPDAICLQGWLAEYRQQAVQQVFLEVSSHALCQGRVDGIAFRQAIFTNLSHEHLDYHETMTAYAEAKSKLFGYPSLQSVILNHDDAYTPLMREKVYAPECQVLTYGFQYGADLRAYDAELGMTGSCFSIDSPWGNARVEIKPLGLFNIYNALAVLGSLLARGVALTDAALVLKNLTSPPGRMEVVSLEPCVIVDYAHTPDALAHALITLQELKQGKLRVVFGCGGNRDKDKRSRMGEIASRYADQVILTNDNPRKEDPQAILNAIAQGIPPQFKAMEKIEDREEAIAIAIAQMMKGDILLIAGKGHEAYQEIGDTRYDFSDRGVVQRILKA